MNMLKEKLLVLQSKIEIIKELEKVKGESFNLFSILGMERLEVQTHSAFIFELLNPFGSHMQGTKYLRLFIDHVLNIDDFDYQNVSINREYNAGDFGRIDFTIENREMFIAIEMKIDAGDQEKQLERYKEYASKKSGEWRVYYLTLDGREASEKSVGDNKIRDDGSRFYTTISFAYDIRKWLELCIEASATLPVIRESIVQYKKLIEQLTNKSSKEISMEALKMIDTPEIAEAATEMSAVLGLAWAQKEARFWYGVKDKIDRYVENNGWVYAKSEVFDDDDDEDWKDEKYVAEKIAELRGAKDYSVELELLKEFGKNELTFYMYQDNSDQCIMYYLEDVEEFKLSKLADQLGLDKRSLGDRKGNSPIKINFFGKNVSEPTYDLFKDDFLEKASKEAADDLMKKLKTIDEYFSKNK